MKHKVGDEVYFYYDHKVHKGKIVEISNNKDFPIKVEAEDGSSYTFTENGYYFKTEIQSQRLSFTPFEVKIEGATYERPEEKTKVKEEKTFPRMMWVWNKGLDKYKQLKNVYYIHQNTSRKPYKSVLTVHRHEDHSDSEWFDFAEDIEDKLSLSIEEAKNIIAEAKGVDVSEVNIETK